MTTAGAIASPGTVLYLRQGAFFFGVAGITLVGIAILMHSTSIGENKYAKNLWGDRIGISGIATGAGAIVVFVTAALLDKEEVTNISRRLRIVMLAAMGLSAVVLFSAKVLKNRGWISDKSNVRLQWISSIAIIATPTFVLIRGIQKAPDHFISKTYQGIKAGISYIAAKIFKRG